MILLSIVFVAQISIGRSVLPAFLMLAATMIPFSYAIGAALFFGVGYEALAFAPFGLSIAGMLAGVVITSDILCFLKEQSWGGRIISALGGIAVYACIMYGGAYYVARSAALIPLGVWETGLQMVILVVTVLVWGVVQYMSSRKSYGYHT